MSEVEQYLTRRVEELTKEKAALESALAAANSQLRSMPQDIYREMAQAAVNCGPHYGCGLAARRCES